MSFSSDYTNRYYFLQDSLQYNLSKPVLPAINFTFELPKWDFSMSQIQQPWFNCFNPPQLTVPDISYSAFNSTPSYTIGDTFTPSTTSPASSATTPSDTKISMNYSKAENIPEKAKPYLSIIQKYAKEYNVPESLILSVIQAESGFNPNAESHCGAKGLMQLMPGTAKDNGVTDVYDPEQNIKAGVKILSKYLKQYNGNLNKVLAAYNWGPGNLQRKGLANMPQETKTYIARVTQNYNKYNLA